MVPRLQNTKPIVYIHKQIMIMIYNQSNMSSGLTLTSKPLFTKFTVNKKFKKKRKKSQWMPYEHWFMNYF